MIVAKTSLGNNELLIEALDESVEIAGGASVRQTEGTAIEDKLQDAYGRVKSIISSMAGDFAESLKQKMASGQSVELEFNLGLSASSGFWVISGKGECAIKVKMIWEADRK